ncbi:hypothetical protein BKA70DRAFT_1095825 [Coprinopsis sp. MPI-PUGE-AT-0042]|nr:hypothetical protein BKA70DRAFT_1095825 [Coprinopsis sp. MPI-PUGE-AT-0042]
MSPRPIWHVARARTSSISSNGSVDGDGDEDYNPPSSASRLTSPRSLAEIRGRINQTIARTPESSPRSAGRFGAIPRDSTSSPSQKRLSSPSILSSAAVRELGASPSGSRTISRSNRLSLPPPAKSPAPATSIGEQSTLRVPRRSLIPVSPRKNRSIRAQPTEPLERHDGTADMDISSSLSDNEWMAQPDAGLQPPAQDDQSSADRTPTLKTVEPPPEDDPPSQPEDLTDNEQRPEEAHYDTDVPSDSDQGDSSAHELPSFTATPPRHAASSSQSRVEPDSPQRSFEVPELPGPPTDESESEGPWSTPAPTRLFPSDPNNTAAKTPKPPGGWLNTPAPRRRSRAYSDSSSQRSNFLAPPSNAANWSAIETPKPPGGWLATPAPKKVEYVDQSVETDTEPEGGPNGFDSSAADTEDGQGQPPQMLGLVTPVSSLPRGKYHNAQTPAAPGAWVQTPAARKSVMKVRFDPQPSDTREFATDTGDESAASDTAPVRSQPETASLQTPPASPEVEQLSPSKRKTPSVRVLDAYGNETREEEDRKMDFSSIKTPRRQPIRFVDALGNAVEDPSVDGLEESLVKEEEGAPAGESREQILSKVKQGLDQLVSEIHDLDCSSSLLKSDLAHIKELDSVSLASREKRRKLVKELGEATAIVKEQAKSLKPANSQVSTSSSAIGTIAHTPLQPTLKYITSRSSLWSLGFLSLVLLQLLLAGFFY